MFCTFFLSWFPTCLQKYKQWCTSKTCGMIMNFISGVCCLYFNWTHAKISISFISSQKYLDSRFVFANRLSVFVNIYYYQPYWITWTIPLKSLWLQIPSEGPNLSICAYGISIFYQALKTYIFDIKPRHG